MGELYTSHIPEMGKDYGTAHLDGSKMADENTGQRHRELFERYCRQKFHDGGRGCSKTVSSKKRENIIKFLSKKDVPGASAHFRFWVKNRGFQMVDMDGKSVLCLPNKQRVPSDPSSVEWKKVAAVEEFFEIISAYHCTEDGFHLGIKKTLAKIALEYECLTRTAVEGYMELCPGCRSRNRKGGKVAALSASVSWGTRLHPLTFMSSAQVDLIDMSPHRDGQYQWIGHFTDHWSCFHVLFPLTSVSAEEVAQNLCRYVLGVFGVPQSLFCNLGRQFTTQVVQAVTRCWPGEVDMDVGTQRVHNPALDQATNKLEEMIANYVLHKPLWTQWLPYMQYTLNTELTSRTSKAGQTHTPFTTLFTSASKPVNEEGEGEREGEGGGGYSEGDEDGEEGGEDEGEGEGRGEGEELQMEVISDAISQNAEAPVWQLNIQPVPPTSTAPSATVAVVQTMPASGANGSTSEGAASGAKEGGGGGGGGGGEDMSVQQILMPPDTDFLSSFYEAAQLSNSPEGNSRKRKRKQTPIRVAAAATPTKTTPPTSVPS